MFGSNKRPFIIQEVIDQGGESIKGEDYLQTGRITNFKFGLELGKVSEDGKENGRNNSNVCVG